MKPKAYFTRAEVANLLRRFEYVVIENTSDVADRAAKLDPQLVGPPWAAFAATLHDRAEAYVQEFARGLSWLVEAEEEAYHDQQARADVEDQILDIPEPDNRQSL
jgi:hypothetical protein